MSRRCDLAVVGAGPAGLAAACEAREHGLSVLVIDEQHAPGGQIYRDIEKNVRDGDRIGGILGTDYLHGRALVEAFRRSGADYLPGAAVWRADADGALWISCEGRTEQIHFRRLILATGAMERPVPVPGWTMPGVMGAGGAQVLLKSSGLVPEGRVVLAGSGPLLLLVAQQLIEAGCTVAAVLETTRRGDYLAAAPTLPRALRVPVYLRKGLAMRRRIGAAGVPILGGVEGLRIEGNGRAERVRFRHRAREADLAADIVLLHQGVVPNVQITRQLGCDHAWGGRQRYWKPVLDDWGNTSIDTIAVAGDGGGIGGAEAAAVSGRLAALEAVHRAGSLSREERDARGASLRRDLARHLSIRPLLDTLYRPTAEVLTPPDGETIVCRCEEVTAGMLREGVALGATGPNQLKAYLRCGMGPCQGRMCGLVVSEVIAAARGVPVPEIGYYRIRPPIKPVTLGELAALEP